MIGLLQRVRIRIVRKRGPADGRGRVRDGGRDLLRGVTGENEAFQQGVGGQPVRSVHAVAAAFADGEQAGQGGASRLIGLDAAHQIVLGGDDRDQVAREVEPFLGAPL